MVDAYARWLGEGPELAILRLLGLFDRPAEAGALKALRAAPPIPGLTEPLVDLSEEDWHLARRLYEHLRQAAPDLPDTLEAMQPLYAAVVHGCRAGRQQEVMDEVFSRRIRRGNQHFAVNKLGGWASDLTGLAGFSIVPGPSPPPASQRREREVRWLEGQL